MPPPPCMRVHVTEFTLARRYITPADAELLVNMDVALEGVDRVLLLGMRTCMWIAAHACGPRGRGQLQCNLAGSSRREGG